jgi:periplasmic protein TonB
MTTAAVWTTFEPDRRNEAVRWTAAAAMVLLAHAAIITPYMMLERPDSAMQAEEPAITIDFAPPEVVQPDPAPPVEEQKPEEPPPPPVEATTPPPEEVAPPDPEPPPPPKEELTRPEEKPVPSPRVEKPKVVQPKKPPPKPRQASLAPAVGAPSVASSASQADWRGSLRAALLRNKRYPSEAASNHETGSVVIAFAVDRGGRVVSRHVVRSSGHPSLDQEALATVDRSQPLPAPPADISSGDLKMTVPLNFTLH